MSWAYTLIRSLNNLDLISSLSTVFTAEFPHSICADHISYSLCSAASLAHVVLSPSCPSMSHHLYTLVTFLSAVFAAKSSPSDHADTISHRYCSAAFQASCYLSSFSPSTVANRSICLEHNAACGLCAPHHLVFCPCLMAFVPFIALWSLCSSLPCSLAPFIAL